MIPQDLELQRKGLQLAAHIEHLYQTDETFRHWYQAGIDDIESGRVVTLVYRNGEWKHVGRLD
jgi:hypothetical protein